MPAVVPSQEFDLNLTSGRIRLMRTGPAHAPLTLLVHGLSAHLHCFDELIEKLAAPDRQIVALDLRGRGRSELTPPGTYGIEAHARDVLELADQLRAKQFDLAGWSMGGAIGVLVANRAPGRLRRLVLIDAPPGEADEGAMERVVKGLNRLDLVVKRPSDYVAAIRATGGISPWTAFWDRFFEYELGPIEGGFRPTTSKAACVEDLDLRLRRDWHDLWKGITMPAMLVRCTVPIGGGFAVPEGVRDAMRRAIPQLQVVEDASDHFTVMNSRTAAKAMAEFLSEEGVAAVSG